MYAYICVCVCVCVCVYVCVCVIYAVYIDYCSAILFILSSAPAPDFSATMQRLCFRPRSRRHRFPGPSGVPIPGAVHHLPGRSRRSHVRSSPSATVWKSCLGPTGTRQPLASIGALAANRLSP
uniref:Uncharacterized protein n=1 Tax=Schizaphis graminum TaxID=13262 RepID=A0A2S2NSK4_SCHGA